MIELWYAIVALLFTAWVLLDGADLGAGALHLTLARDAEERAAVIDAIHPYWHGNEVCLLAAGGALFLSFPAALAAGLSGFALALFLVLWLLILRGIAIEFRGLAPYPMWRSAWDVVFGLASTLLPPLLGAALGNVLRGVPLDAHGWFELPLFTDFSATAPVGVLDWFTLLVGLFALLALATHGAAFLAWHAHGAVQTRARERLPRLWLATGGAWLLVSLATARVNPELFGRMVGRPLAWLASAVALAGFVGVALATRRQRAGLAFAASLAFLGGLLGATAASLYPVLLRGVGPGASSLLATTAAAPHAGLVTALTWFCIGAPLALSGFIVVFRIHRPRAANGAGRSAH